MSFWDKIQEDLKKNLQEGIDIFKEGGSVFSKKIEELTEGGKKKYKVFNLNMKVQDEFAKLGGQVYDLISAKSKNPLGNKKATSIINKINKLESQINKLEAKEAPKVKKKTTSIKKTTTKKKPTTKKKTITKKKAVTKKKTAVKKKVQAGKS